MVVMMLSCVPAIAPKLPDRASGTGVIDGRFCTFRSLGQVGGGIASHDDARSSIAREVAPRPVQQEPRPVSHGPQGGGGEAPATPARPLFRAGGCDRATRRSRTASRSSPSCPCRETGTDGPHFHVPSGRRVAA